MNYDVAIIGAGVIGGMIARELSKYKLSVALLEKENDVACGASKANSGIVHGGFDPEPGTLKARLNADGVEKLFKTAQMLHVPHRRNGSMVCAFGADEEKTLKELYERGIENGVKGMEIISGDKARKLEPNLSAAVSRVLHIPSAGIICPYELTIAAVGNAMDNGVALIRNFEVTVIARENSEFTVTAANGETVTAKYIVNCAGCHSDKIAAIAGDGFFEMIPRAGQYILLDKTEGSRVDHTIFQVPTKEGKGILVTPTVDGNLLTGPTAEHVKSAEDTETTSEGLLTVMRLAAKSVPDIGFRQVITSFSGVRSSEKDGDFIIKASEKLEGLLHVAAIDSPGLSSSVSIAEYTAEVLRGMGLKLTKKSDWNGERENPHAFREMNDDQKDAYIKEHPDFGRIICRCETVTEGEIRAAIRRNPPALDIDAVKRRTRAGMGRCQGGFCMPYVMRMIAEENGIEMDEVTKKGGSSKPLTGRI